ncbi:sensor histidine kinase [Nannocystis radixulma]|uniref:histidine kinase n=1 Tax=Nannocystis radixulma TaxID=2995305 RepID=A0ABT5AXJ7_9BACT|nr:HAMP domain-containing sensor histidine kinase [Nannocystis radixulma]MDC0666570.1 HAMP domain-containing sensor histidine kinase [Nannocystis radixulma]
MAALEAALAATREPPSTPSDGPADFRSSLYEAYVYGLGRTLSLYDPGSVRVLVREMGRRIREYLEEVGYDLGGAGTLDEVLEKTIGFFVAHGFVDLEVVKWEDNQIHARWHRLLGLRAYERIVAAGGETFISCPLSAVIHDGLAAFGKELTLRENKFDLERSLVESWEAVVDIPAEAQPQPLSLDAERMFALEREQSRQLRVRDEFIRIASHELSTPLTATKLALRRLDGAELPDAAKHAVGVLNRQVRRLEQLVSEMLETTRLQIGRVRLERTEVDLVAATRAVIELLVTAESAEPEQIRLHGDGAAVGLWDAARLDQIVTNLLTNAIKYGEGRPVDVTITQHDDHARLQVRDRGIGIAAESLGRIFEPFERAAPVETHGGLGLGLYIARRFVEMHGGRIAVDSEPGAGATFIVDLPLANPLAPGAILEVQRARQERTP